VFLEEIFFGLAGEGREEVEQKISASLKEAEELTTG